MTGARMEVPKIEAEAQTEVRRGARVVVAVGRHPKLVLDMFLAVLRGLVLVLLHLINRRVVWQLIERLR
jgi:hypothetical protein